MEYCIPQLLDKQQLLHILQERHLHIENAEALSQEELYSIYNRFVMPLAKRDRRLHENGSTHRTMPPNTMLAAASKKRHMQMDRDMAELQLNDSEGSITPAKRLKCYDEVKTENFWQQFDSELTDLTNKKCKLMVWQ